jgi:hypothetical protein
MRCASASFAVGARCQIRLARLLYPSANASRPVIRFLPVFLRADFDQYSQKWLATCAPQRTPQIAFP